jgi:hypothetical protein
VIWANAAAFLQDLTEHSSIASREHSDRALLGDLSGQKNKKRKADKDSNGAVGESAEAVSRRKASTELVQRSEHVLSSVKAACVHDSEGFIDEVIQTLCMLYHAMHPHTYTQTPTPSLLTSKQPKSNLLFISPLVDAVWPDDARHC